MASEKSKNIKPDRQSIEFRLRERERFLRTLIANLPGVVFRCRADQSWVSSHNRGKSPTGFTATVLQICGLLFACSEPYV